MCINLIRVLPVVWVLCGMKIHTSNEAFILKVVYEVSIFISETSSISSSSQILLSYVKMYMFICNRVRINDYKPNQTKPSHRWGIIGKLWQGCVRTHLKIIVVSIGLLFIIYLAISFGSSYFVSLLYLLKFKEIYEGDKFKSTKIVFAILSRYNSDTK